jgi:hypothetical protein
LTWKWEKRALWDRKFDFGGWREDGEPERMIRGIGYDDDAGYYVIAYTGNHRGGPPDGFIQPLSLAVLTNRAKW